MENKFPIDLAETKPYYITSFGRAYLGDSIDLLKGLPHQSQVKVFMKLSRIERKPMVPVYRIYACV